MEKKFRLMVVMVTFPERKQELLLFQQPRLAVSDLPMLPSTSKKGILGNTCSPPRVETKLTPRAVLMGNRNLKSYSYLL